MYPPHGPRRVIAHEAQGVALVIVLTFIVLLTGLMVAFFARAVTNRQLSNSSAGQTRAALLAKSAADYVIGGFKSEIDAGSTSASYNGANSSAYKVYTPKVPATGPSGTYMVPVRYPSYATGTNPDPIPNLVRESKSGDASIPAPALTSFASAVNSATDSAVGGRNVTLARWNSHYLIPAFTAVQNAASGSTVPPSTPDTFTAPDWVLVNRTGPTVVANNSTSFTGTNAVNNSDAANSKFVIGRYAYAVYDEGGLLDMNVAGHPTPAATAATTGFTATQISRKGSLAMADLTQLPIVKTPASTNDYLAQSVVDQIVGWRNYASAGFTTATPYPNFTFTSLQGANWFKNFANYNATGFLSVYGGALGSTGSTDQAFLSRQQLLKLRSSLGFSANALQYMGTFSRSLDQPSFIPAHISQPASAPSINTVGSSAPPPAAMDDSYQGNNDAAGSSNGTLGQDLDNPSFLTVRVANSFSRNDGTNAVAGEPLVKRRFSLQRLAWLTYKGPSANNLSDTNVMQLITAMGGDSTNTSDPVYKMVAQGTAANIKKYFGLSWSLGNHSAIPPDPPGWTYSHGATHIMTLSEVAAANREPDFAELLKAATNVGSLAKGGPNLPAGSCNYQYVLDTAVDYNVLQIMANLVDQFDLDSYSTIVKFAAGSVTRYFRGVEDLPYFYRYHPMTVVTRLPNPNVPRSNTVDFYSASTGTKVATLRGCQKGTSVTDAGNVVFMYVPDVWNPHDPSFALANNSSGGPNSPPRPNRFRLAVISQDPAQQTTIWNPGVLATFSGSYSSGSGNIPPAGIAPSATAPLGTEASTAFIFSDNNGQLFREPTLMYRADAPTNSAIGIDSGDQGTSLAGPFTDANTGVAYYGVQIGQTPITFAGTVSSAYVGVPYSSTNQYIFQANSVAPIQSPLPTGSYAQYTFRLQYKDPNGSDNWVTYDEKYPDFHGLYPPNIVANTTDFPNGQFANIYASGQMNDSSTGYDPRTARFGIGTEGTWDEATSPFEEPYANANYKSNTTAGNSLFAGDKPTVINSQRPGSDRGNHINYSNPCMTSDPGRNTQMRWFDGVGFSASNSQTTSPLEYAGLLSQNDQRQIFPSTRLDTTPQHNPVTSQVHLYYEDADGVDRRAMGAYSYSAATATLSSTYTTSNMEGLPEAIANSYSSGSTTGTYGVGTPKAQSLSRPIVLNRPFRSVAEMAYASRGGVWKNIDFFTPESGDTALLDVFTVNDTSANGLVAGKVSLNTHQAPVLQAIAAGTARDELNNLSTAPGYALPPLSKIEAANVAQRLSTTTMDTVNAWRGPLTNTSELVGRYVPVAPTVPTTPANANFTDFYTSSETFTGKSYSFAGPSASLDNSVYSGVTANYKIQRMRESAIRAMADSGQTRVWNLLIDVIAQTGRYAPNATALSQFTVDGENRYWVHIAIDRFTGEVIDKQIELVSE